MMKVLLINTVNLEANGISAFIINTANQLIKNNVDVTILASNKVDIKLASNLRNKGIHIKEIIGRMSNPVKYFKRLETYLSSEKFDVVHVNGNSTTMSVELLAARLAGIKKRIAHSHNTTTKHPIINKILRPLFEFSVNGRLACNDAAGKWLFKSNKFIIIPNGINLIDYKFSKDKREKIREELHIKENEILLGHVGEFNYQKNQIFLIKLLKELPPNYKLILIGQGKELNNIKLKVQKLNLNNRVIFTGVISDVSDYLNAMDIFLLPSNFEGQPFVLVEASASGLPCIISKFVSREVNITEKIIFLPLDVKKWKDRIIRTSNTNRMDTSAYNICLLRKKGYDLEENGIIFKKIYSHL